MAKIKPAFYVRQWTFSTIKCYLKGCVCNEDCEIVKNLESVNYENCYVKTAVVELVRKCGVPIIRGQDFSRGNKDVL